MVRLPVLVEVYMLKEIDLKNIKIKDDFWTPFQNKVIDMVIPYQEKILRDAIEDAEKSHAIENFEIAAGLKTGEFYGMVFQDSDVAKWLEGASYSLIIRPNADLEERMDAIIDVIEKAQQPDGYLDTYFIIKEPDKKWTNLLEGHELYCAGHMIEAGVAYYEATGKDKLLKVCMRLADHIDEVFRIGGKAGYPGHQEIELAAVKLYKATGKETYLKLAAHFLNARGEDIDFFAKEKEARDFDVFGMDPDNHDYNQSFAPVRDQKEAVGHAVRAVYMYEAMADVAAATEDKELLEACHRLWDNITQEKMFVTGGIGSDGSLESFASGYYLPNDVAYNETCAQIGMMFFTKKMLDAGKKPSGKYADIMDLLIYNSTISGMQYDGTRFFYVNPLEVNPGISGQVFGHKHVVPERPKWYACACCPPNLVRMITSLGKYAWSVDGDKVYSHFLIGQEVSFDACDISVKSKYPWEGKVEYHIIRKTDDMELAIHLPGFVKKYKVIRGGADVTADTLLEDGYLYFNNFAAEENIAVSFDLEVRYLYADNRVVADGLKCAIKRGPIVYCFEGVDNGDSIQSLRIDRDSKIELTSLYDTMDTIVIAGNSTVTRDSLKPGYSLKLTGSRASVSTKQGLLYTDKAPEWEKVQLTAIPYYMWGNRGLTQMRVWMPY